MTGTLRISIDKNNGFVNRGFTDKELSETEVEIQPQANLESNEIGVVELNGKQLLKRYINQKGNILLIEPSADPIVVDKTDSLEIVGKATRIIYSFN